MSNKLLNTNEVRKIGSYELPPECSPEKENWFEPETVNELNIKNDTLYGKNLIQGSSFQGDINYSLWSDAEKKEIVLTGRISYPFTIQSEARFDENKFGNDIYDVVLQMGDEESIESVINGKEIVKENISKELLSSHNILCRSTNLFNEDAYAIFYDLENKPRTFADCIELSEEEELEFSFTTGYIKTNNEINNASIIIYCNGKEYVMDKAFTVVENQLGKLIGSLKISGYRFQFIRDIEDTDLNNSITETRKNTHRNITNNEDLVTEFLLSRSKFLEKPEKKSIKRRQNTLDIL